MEIQNPYLTEKRQLVLAVDKETDPQEKAKLQARLNKVELRSRAYIEGKLKALGHKRYVLEEHTHSIRKEYDTDTKQYKRACDLYKEIMQLVEENRQLKKDLREEIKQRRGRK